MNELEVTYRNKLCYFGCQLVKILVISALHYWQAQCAS